MELATAAASEPSEVDAYSDSSRPSGLQPAPVDWTNFDCVYAHYFLPVSRWIRAFGAPEYEVEDLTQEVFLVVRRKLALFDGRNLPGWIYRIAQRTVSDHRRRAWFRRLIHRSAREPDSLPCGHRGPGESLERREAQRLLGAILDQMSFVRRTAFTLFEIEGYSCEEIAKLERIPVNTVYTRLYHARKDFLRLVEETMGRSSEGAP